MESEQGALVLSGLTLVVTIAGWFYTYRVQIDIQDRQRQIDKKLQSYKFSTLRILEQLKEFMDWIDKGYEVFMLSVNEINSREKMKNYPVSPNHIEKELTKMREQYGSDYIAWASSTMKFMMSARRVWDKTLGKRRRKANRIESNLLKFTEAFGEINDAGYKQALGEPVKLLGIKNNPKSFSSLITSYEKLVSIVENYVERVIEDNYS